VLSVLLILLSLVPFAHASPPDPTWILGIYDDADGDDVVVLIEDTVASREGDIYERPSLRDLSEEVSLRVPTVYDTARSAICERGPPRILLSGTNHTPLSLDPPSSFFKRPMAPALFTSLARRALDRRSNARRSQRSL